jgi:hypothetical protein
MKYFIAHVIALLIATTALIIPMWACVHAHFILKLILGALALLSSGFFVERVASKWINKLVATIFPDNE